MWPFTRSRRNVLFLGVVLLMLEECCFLWLSRYSCWWGKFGQCIITDTHYTVGGRNMHACLVAQLCPALCNPMDWSPPGSSVHGIFQARILEWVAISSSRGSPLPKDWTHVSCISCVACGFFTFWVTREARLRGERRSKGRKECLCLIFSCFAINYEFYFTWINRGLV